MVAGRESYAWISRPGRRQGGVMSTAELKSSTIFLALGFLVLVSVSIPSESALTEATPFQAHIFGLLQRDP